MAVSTLKQPVSNRRNALAGIGPGPVRRSHTPASNTAGMGLLVKGLSLTPEEQSEFDALHAGLITDFAPESLIERVLVEKVAVCIWRQQRLLQAEAAMQDLALRQQLQKAYANTATPGQTAAGRFKNDFTGMSDAALLLLAGEMKEGRQNPLGPPEISLDEIATIDPSLHERILAEAESRGQTPEALLVRVGGVAGFLRGIMDQRSRQAVEERNLTVAAQRIQQIDTEPLANESLIRAQSALDTELYKALRQLREIQRWRMTGPNTPAGQRGLP
jgi:hypothetical protein